MSNHIQTQQVPEPELVAKWRSDTQREWSDEEKVAAWRKWRRQSQIGTRGATEALIRAADISSGQRVIDIAGGGGDPGIAVAAQVGATGRVTITDVSPGMLETARMLADEDGLENLEYYEADAENLPFDDESFDRAVSRFGVMFFADADRSLREILRVVKPGGRAALLAWGPLEQNELFTSIMGPVRTHGNAPAPPPPGAPWMFRYAESGKLAAALEQAGFADVTEESVPSRFEFDGSPDEILEMVLDMSGLHGMLAELPEESRTALLDEALENYRSYSDEKGIRLPLAFVVASGIR